jgi:hypothetical protein
MEQLSLSVEAQQGVMHPLDRRLQMSRIILVSLLAALLAGCGTQSANQTTSAPERLACADVGIDPGRRAYGQCVADLQQALWDDQSFAR